MYTYLYIIYMSYPAEYVAPEISQSEGYKFHSLPHGNTLQKTATHCNTLQHIQINHVTHAKEWKIQVPFIAITQIRVIWLVLRLDMTHSYEWHVLRDMTHSHVWHDSFISVSWLMRHDSFISVYDSRDVLIHMWHDSWDIKPLTCVIWPVHTSDMTHSFVLRDSLWHASREINSSRDTTHAYVKCTHSHVQHDSFMCDTTYYVWHHLCDMTCSCVWRDIFVRVAGLVWCASYIRVTWLIRTCDVTRVMWSIHTCDTTRVRWSIHRRETTNSYKWHNACTPLSRFIHMGWLRLVGSLKS